MGALDAALAAILIAHSVDIARLDANEKAKVLDLLKRLESDLTKLLSVQVLSEMGKQSTNAVLREVTALIQGAYTEAAITTQETLAGLAEVQSTATVQALESVLNITIGPGSKPTAGYLEKLASNVLIEGAPSAQWWSKQAGDTAFRFSQAVRTGLAAGETNQQIIARVAGTKDVPGVMDIARKNAAALVQTSVQTVANEARLATFRKNADITNGVRYLATLDSHTCSACGVRDGLTWDLDGKPLEGNDLPFAAPPIHFNCRCTTIAVLKPMSEISGGTLPDLPNNGMRASTDGPVKATVNFSDWFAGRTESQQAEQFGAGKAAMYRAGKISLRDMLDQKGNTLTLDALRKRHE